MVVSLQSYVYNLFMRLQVGLDCGCFLFFSAALCKCGEHWGSIV